MILTLKKVLALSVISVFLGSAIVWGLKETAVLEGTVGGGIVVEAAHYPLKLTMVFNKTTFEAGKIVDFTFILENIGNETLAMRYYYYGIDYFSYIVYDEHGQIAYEPPERAWLALSMPPEPLPSGLAHKTVMYWHQPYNFLPGKYQIVGLFISHKLHLNLTIETPPVTITLA